MTTKRAPFVGDPRDAMNRVVEFVKRVEAFTGKPPETVVVFAEDYDVAVINLINRGFRIVRGPSIEEYFL